MTSSHGWRFTDPPRDRFLDGMPAASSTLSNPDDLGGLGMQREESILGTGEIRMPAQRPTPIYGSWASQTASELFPSVMPSALSDGDRWATPKSPTNSGLRDDIAERAGLPHAPMTSLGMHTPVNETDGMPLEMPKSISNLLDDDDDEPGHQFVVQSDHRSPVQVHVGKADIAAGGRQVDIVLEKQGAQPDLGKIMLVAEHTKLFPPPPPPLDAEAPDPVTGLARDSMHKRMMRWYQVTELWCKAEEAVPDKERVIVAPPPRPPPFADTHGVVFPVPTAPVAYSFDRWMAQCRRWWGHVAHHYDNLRSGERFEPAKHVSTGPVELTDRRILLQLCVVDL